MPVYPIQPAFSAGELAPALYGRVDYDQYHTALKTCRNFLIHRSGGASNRPGTYMVNEVKDSSKKAKLQRFVFNKEQAYVIEFGHKYCRFYIDGGLITVTANGLDDYSPDINYAKDYNLKVGPFLTCDFESGKKLHIAAPYGQFEAITVKVKVETNILDDLEVTAIGDTIIIKLANSSSGYNKGNYIQRSIRSLGIVNGVEVTNWTVTENQAYAANRPIIGNIDATPLNPNNKLYRALQTCIGNPDNTSFFPPDEAAYWTEIAEGEPVEISTVYKDADLYDLDFAQSADVMVITNAKYPPKTLTRLSHYNWIFADFDFKNGPYMRANLTNTKLVFKWNNPVIKDYKIIEARTLKKEVRGSFFKTSHVGSWWRVGNANVKIISVIDDIRCRVESEDDPDNNPTIDWAEGAWSDYRGYPSCVMFYAQDRLCFGNGITLWLSQTGDYYNFGRSSPLVDTDGITVTLQGREVNAIQNLLPIDDIIALTTAGSWKIGPPEGSPTLTPTSVSLKAQEYRGSSNVRPVIIGDRGIYVQSQGTIIQDIGFDFSSNKYKSLDISFQSSHLFEGHQIIEMAYQEEPDSIVWAVRDDGILLTLTYLREQHVLAWTHCDTDGQIESVCCIPSFGHDELWMLVKRGDKRFIERLANRTTSKDPADQYFVDCGLSFDYPLAIEAISLANPVQITITGHGLSNGDIIDIADIKWEMKEDWYGNPIPTDQLNGRYTVANATADTFTLQKNGMDVDGTKYLKYISGGVVRKAVTSVSGLSHLNGRQVVILADGNVLPRQTVTDGSIVLKYPASRIHVGLPYSADLETLNMELPMNDGRLQSRRVHIPKVTIRFHDSRGGWIGPDQYNLREVKQRAGERWDAPIGLFTGDYEESIVSGYDKGGRIFFRQRDPLPVTILAVMPVVELGG